MTLSRSPTCDDEPDAEDPAAALRPPAWAAEQLEVIRELRDMGMTLARNLTRRVVAETEAAEAAAEAGEPEAAPRRGAVVDPALSFSRLSRAVRLTLALEAQTYRQIEDASARSEARARAANDDAPGDDAPTQDEFMTPDGQIDYLAIRRRLNPQIHGETDFETRRAVEETIEASTCDPDEVERLKTELKERLETEDPEDVFFNRTHWPIGEAIALICQDLGLDPDWDRWENRAWARDEAERSPPGSPYATIEQPDRVHYTGTENYRLARGLPPLEGSLTFKAARGPP